MNYEVTYMFNGKVCLQGKATASLAMALADHIGELIVGKTERAEYDREMRLLHDWIFNAPGSGEVHILLVRSACDCNYILKVTRV